MRLCHDNHNNSSSWLQSLHKLKMFQVPVLLFIVLISLSDVAGQTNKQLEPRIQVSPLPPFKVNDTVTFTCTLNVRATLTSGQRGLYWSREGGLPAKHEIVPSEPFEDHRQTFLEVKLIFKITASDHGRALICSVEIGVYRGKDTHSVQVDLPTTTTTTTTTTSTTTTTTTTTTSTTEQTTEETEEPPAKEEPTEDKPLDPFILIAIGGAIGLVVMIPVIWWFCRKRKPEATPQPQQLLVMGPTSSFVFSAPQPTMMMQYPEQDGFQWQGDRGSLMGPGSQIMTSMMAEEAPLFTQPNGDASPDVLNQPMERAESAPLDLGFIREDQHPPSVGNSHQPPQSVDNDSHSHWSWL